VQPTPPRRKRRHVAARSRTGVAVGSVAACVALAGGFAYQDLGASTSASSTTPTANQDNGVPGDPFTNPAAPIPNGDGLGGASGAVPGQLGGGANTTSRGS
jgi:hypothetical protein